MTQSSNIQRASQFTHAPGWLIWSGAAATLALIWQCVLTFGLVSPKLLPPLGDVLAKVWILLRSPQFHSHAVVTFTEVAVAFLIAVPAAVLAAVVIAERPILSRALKPPIFIAFAIPKSIFLPMFILAMGINFWQKVAFGVFSTVFIVLISTFAALESIRPEHVRVARVYGATRRQIAARVYLPSMMPVLLEAGRLALIFNLTGILLAEMYASRAGIGQLISTWGENYMLTDLLAGVLIVAVASILLNEGVRMIEGRLEQWRQYAL